MARTIQEIKDAIIAEKGNHPELDGLNSNSQTAIWNLWVYITAVAHYALETLWDIMKAEVEDNLARNIPGTPNWYVERAYEFQYGDTLIYDRGILTYAVIDETKQIVARAAGQKLPNGNFILKVAREVVIDPVTLETEVQPLDSVQFAAFNSYVNKILFAGSYIQTRSLPSDKLRVYATIHYDPEFPLDSDLRPRVLQAIDDLLANMPFNGNLKKTQLVDAIQAVQGVLDVEIADFRSRPDDTPTYNPQQPREVLTESGYLVIDPAHPLYVAPSGGSPAGGSLTFTPQTII